MTAFGSKLVQGVLGGCVGAASASTYFLVYGKNDSDLAKSDFKYGIPECGSRILKKNGVIISYDPIRKTPLWVAEHITAKNLEGSADRSGVSFACDTGLPEHQRATNDDFFRSGWTRGHMAAAGNYKHSQNDMKSTFDLSNIVPQEYENNSGYWYMLENYARQLAKKHQHIQIFSGPLWLPIEEKGDKFTKQIIKYQVIGDHLVSVPTHLYKLIIAENNNSKPLVSAFMVPNSPVPLKQPLKSFQIPLIQLRNMLGLDLVPKLASENAYTDLCSGENDCKLDDLPGFAQFKYLRDLNGDRNLHFLNRTWSRIEREGMDKDPILRDAYFKRIQQFFNETSVKEA